MSDLSPWKEIQPFLVQILSQSCKSWLALPSQNWPTTHRQCLAETHSSTHWCSSGKSSAQLWRKEIKSQKMPSLSSGQLGHWKEYESCHSSHQKVSHADTFLYSGVNRQQSKRFLTQSVEDISSNNRKEKLHLCFYSPQEANRVRHRTIMATFTISSSYTQDQQKPLRKPLVLVFFPCLLYNVLIRYFLKKVKVVFQKAWPRTASIS